MSKTIFAIGVGQTGMRFAAEKQAHERAVRENATMFVYRRVGYPTPSEVSWYVRSREEGIPENSSLELVAEPGGIA